MQQLITWMEKIRKDWLKGFEFFCKVRLNSNNWRLCYFMTAYCEAWWGGVRSVSWEPLMVRNFVRFSLLRIALPLDTKSWEFPIWFWQSFWTAVWLRLVSPQHQHCALSRLAGLDWWLACCDGIAVSRACKSRVCGIPGSATPASKYWNAPSCHFLSCSQRSKQAAALRRWSLKVTFSFWEKRRCVFCASITVRYWQLTNSGNEAPVSAGETPTANNQFSLLPKN